MKTKRSLVLLLWRLILAIVAVSIFNGLVIDSLLRIERSLSLISLGVVTIFFLALDLWGLYVLTAEKPIMDESGFAVWIISWSVRNLIFFLGLTSPVWLMPKEIMVPVFMIGSIVSAISLFQLADGLRRKTR